VTIHFSQVLPIFIKVASSIAKCNTWGSHASPNLAIPGYCNINFSVVTRKHKPYIYFSPLSAGITMMILLIYHYVFPCMDNSLTAYTSNVTFLLSGSRRSAGVWMRGQGKAREQRYNILSVPMPQNVHIVINASSYLEISVVSVGQYSAELHFIQPNAKLQGHFLSRITYGLTCTAPDGSINRKR